MFINFSDVHTYYGGKLQLQTDSLLKQRVWFCIKVAGAFVAVQEGIFQYVCGFMGKRGEGMNGNSGVVFSGKWNFLCVGGDVKDSV